MTNSDHAIRVWDLDPAELNVGGADDVRYTTAKIVLLGDSGVGKTGLGWRLAHGAFREHPSTHGQQFWILQQLGVTRLDGTECEAILWDLAGQPDYRLIHALFLDDADLALVLFNPTDRQEPLKGVEYWLRALEASVANRCGVILVGARVDRGDATVTPGEIEEFCALCGVTGGYVATSALRGDEIEELLTRMKGQIAWEDMTSTTTTVTFKQIKKHVLELKEEPTQSEVITDVRGLRERLERRYPGLVVEDAAIGAALQHLSKHGYIKSIRTASGVNSTLLAPDVLNNLAASFVLEARRNPKGLGALEEKRLVRNDYDFAELRTMTERQRKVLLDAAVVLFLERNICFREHLGADRYLIFPELINRKRPSVARPLEIEEDAFYRVRGAVENVYAALVVLLGYTNTFARTEQWQNQAEYEVSEGEICGFTQVSEREGEVEFLLYFGQRVEEFTRTLFRALFEKFLSQRKVTVDRYMPAKCSTCGYVQPREEVIRRVSQRAGSMFCINCGTRNDVLDERERFVADRYFSRFADVRPLSGELQVKHQEATASVRTRFESAVAQLMAYLRERGGSTEVSCFVSYAWGDAVHETWVEKLLARDLQAAGINVLLDKWHSAAIGENIARFVSRITEVEAIVVVGTNRYLEKYTNPGPEGSIVAAEVDVISQRLLGGQAAKSTVKPLLVEGEPESALPPLMRGMVYADFRYEENYFSSLFDVILSLHEVSFENPAVCDLRDSVRSASLSETSRAIRKEMKEFAARRVRRRVHHPLTRR